jgi:hypothetical protein
LARATLCESGFVTGRAHAESLVLGGRVLGQPHRSRCYGVEVVDAEIGSPRNPERRDGSQNRRAGLRPAISAAVVQALASSRKAPTFFHARIRCRYNISASCARSRHESIAREAPAGRGYGVITEDSTYRQEMRQQGALLLPVEPKFWGPTVRARGAQAVA